MSDAEKKGLQQTIRDTWMSALGAITEAEAEVSRAAHRIYDTASEAPGSAREALRVLLERVKHNRDVLEHRVEEGVRTAVARVNKPLALELQGIRSRLEVLQHRIEALTERRRNKGNGDQRQP